MRQLVVRTATLAIVLLLVSVLTFGVQFLLTGDPVCVRLGASCNDPARYELVEQELGLDRSVPERYVTWLGDALTGDLGRAFSDGQSTTSILGEVLPMSIQLLVMAQLLAIVVAVPVALLSAYRQGSWIDRSLTGGTFALLAIPNFVLAPLLIKFLAVDLGWLPSQYAPASRVGRGESLLSLLMPAMTLAIWLGATYARVLRADMISTLQEHYVLLARSKGISPARILVRHSLRPSSFSLLTLIGINTGALIGGSVIVERLFSVPGVGHALIDAIGGRDYDVVQGIVLVIAAAYVVINFTVDVLYVVLDPRLRRAG